MSAAGCGGLPVGPDGVAMTAVWSVPLSGDAVASIEGDVAAFLSSAGVAGRAEHVGRLVVEEIVRNLIEHTPPYASDETAEVTLTVAADAVTVVVEDTRPPFAPDDAPGLDVGAPLEARRPGGMGLHLVRSLTDELRYERHAGRNRLTATVRRA